MASFQIDGGGGSRPERPTDLGEHAREVDDRVQQALARERDDVRVRERGAARVVAAHDVDLGEHDAMLSRDLTYGLTCHTTRIKMGSGLVEARRRALSCSLITRVVRGGGFPLS